MTPGWPEASPDLRPLKLHFQHQVVGVSRLRFGVEGLEFQLLDCIVL